ncbi:tyrosine-protein phosphatase [Brevibacterium samyangense]|uniref:Protein-tyrosine-phosphatase n=1 Tax=Brevibacterium samyangense TaxID=366888 RepID=A0ABP5F434_9MICO
MTVELPQHLAVPGTFNFRDLGGWSSTAGPLAMGVLFRADGLANLDDAAWAELVRWGIRTVIDLRESREVLAAPNALGDTGIELRHMPLFGDRYYPVDEDAVEKLDLPDRSLPTIYRAAIEHSGEQIAGIVEALARTEGPTVFHCSAGKDRTGIVAAFVLDLLAVAREDVLRDYTATEQFLGEDFLAALHSHFAQAGIVANLSHTATQAPVELMEGVFASVEESHGSVLEYLLAHGMDPQVPELLRAKLVLEG